MTIGIALSVKSDLAVSPVSSIPYTITCVWGLEMGKATIVFHFALVALQFLLLRKNFKVKNLAQILIGIVFGYFTTFCNYLVTFLPDPENIGIRLFMMLLSTLFIAAGIFFYMSADIVPLAGEGAMQAVSKVTGIEFSKVKIGFDVSMVVISLVTCLALLGNFGSVGIGTIIAAVLVGTELGMISRLFADKRDRWLGRNVVVTTNENQFVITIAREYGSGGREIGRRVAENLHIPYYDLDVMREAARKLHLAPEAAERSDQSVKNATLQSMYYWYVAGVDEGELPMVEQIFHAQSEFMKRKAEDGPCVIVGRLSNFVLKDVPGIKVFVGADQASKVQRIMERDGLNEKQAMKKIKKVEAERENHCYYFTHTHWKNMSAYDLYVKSDMLGIEDTAKFISILAEKNFNFL